ncbi:hypothetical protein FVEN_g899 [Fusarium venenatum]|uniref:uncharacterized protein n=1 Tax=Fusarium venenatum TaxID=56646 RepID=UPI001D1C2CB1|nr:hypothetical protein FVEN_g899 [Fusarium venenatum]KAH6967275.1 hypothetical protein EDB82DRAFT_569834 [Fusarium venenatum]
MSEDKPALLEALFHHLVLPPKLPRSFDGDNNALKRSLEIRLLDALDTFRDVGDPNVWQTLEASLQATQNLHSSALIQHDILRALENVHRSDGAVWLSIHVEAQNSALIFHADDSGDHVIVEEFQTAAPVADVLKTENALTWDFPSRATSIPFNDFSNESFLDNLTRFLEEASSTSFSKFSATASKGGKSVVEIRDCPSSALIGGILMSLLEAIGTSVHPPQLRKRIRDDIVLDKSELPWRRSPYWLVLRVTLGRLLSALAGGTHESIGRVYYKFIICTVLADLLKDCAGTIQPEMAVMLQAKLSRRLAKLESEKNAASGPLRQTYDDFFTHSSVHFHTILTNANSQVTRSWEDHKQIIVRRIPVLPYRASEKDLVLDLPNSLKVFQQLLSRKIDPARRQVSVDPQLLNEGTVSQVNEFAHKYSALVNLEDRMTTSLSSQSSSEQTCEELALNIQLFISKVGGAYENNPLLMSRYLLRLFELWTCMDKEAIKVCPLLKEYHPIFVPSSLDVLCLQTRQEFARLSEVQEYLTSRICALKPHHLTIFDNSSKLDSFAHKFVYCTGMGKELVTLGEQIDVKSQESKSSKQSELAAMTETYNNLTQSLQGMTCTCTRLPNGKKQNKVCNRCQKLRHRKKLKINAHEDLIPITTKAKKAQRATILFQLSMPSYLSAYRTAVWGLRLLGTPAPLTSKGDPKLLFNDLNGLQKFAKGRSGITLASRKKSFTQTHYGKMRLPKSLSEIIFPFGAEFTCYDSSSGIWADQLPHVPWFEYLMGSWLPRGIPDPYASGESFSQDDSYHPSSYEIVANKFGCPPELSVHEYSAIQRVVSARGRRWLILLVELGTTNFNFSSESTMRLLNHLAVQAGPAVRESGVLREVHSLFDDGAFCATLFELLRGRLNAITSSWREVHYMNLLVTLSVQLYQLSYGKSRSNAETLLVTIRSITCGWIAHLRNEIRSASEGEVASRAATFAFWAALLNRRTFWVYARHVHELNDDDARSFFRASIALQENLLADINQLDPILRGLLIDDLSNSHSMRQVIEEWFRRSYKLLESSINETWTESGAGSVRSYSKWKSLAGLQSGWVSSRVAGTKWTSCQIVHYHFLQGHLIIDGKPLGKLPLQMTQDPVVQELFGSQHLLTRPSGLLEYQLVNDIMGHQVHLGLRDGEVVIQALYRNSLLEYVPRDIFKGSGGYDVPKDLVDNCVHWLNLGTGKLEMRRKPWIWKSKQSNWILNTRNRVAIRNKGTKLVEPSSKLGQQITSIFQHFEDADKLTIYQPLGRGRLSVEMKRLEIRLSVNHKGLLQCPQLTAEIDPNQDAGTLYGLSSQIILRNVVNEERRTVLIPIGDIYWQRRGVHVDVRIINEGMYASFSIDKVLGRLDCPPEPLLLYLKAAVHALTSFPLPDRLTLRTGTEEARHSLMAARSQPWSPLKDFPQRILSVLKSLSPQRYAYPPGIGLYQKVKWDSNLTMWIQHEEFTSLVDSILLQSQQLERVSHKSKTDENILSQQASQKLLCRRGRIRRQLYERISFPSDIDVLTSSSKPFPYVPNKDARAKYDGDRVYQTVCALKANLYNIPKLGRLSTVVYELNSIGGFEDTLTVTDIELLLGETILYLLGSLLQFSRRDGHPQSYDAHFLLAVLAFNGNVDLDVIQWLVTIHRTAELRKLQPPGHLYFTDFHPSVDPSMDNMKALILKNQPSYTDYCIVGKADVRKRTKLDAFDYKRKQMDEAISLAGRVISAWPLHSDAPSTLQDLITDSNHQYIDSVESWKSLKPELERISHNLQLSAYLEQIEDTASRLYQQQSTEQKASAENMWFLKPYPLPIPQLFQFYSAYRVPSLGEDLVKLPHQPSNAFRTSHIIETKSHNATGRLPAGQDGSISTTVPTLPDSLSVLDQIVKRFSKSSETSLRKQYSKDLQISLTALIQDHIKAFNKTKRIIRAADIEKYIISAYEELSQWDDNLRISLSKQFTGSKWLNEGGLWPCMSPVAMLEQLRNTKNGKLSPEMKAELVRYGILITKLQRCLRIRDATLCEDDRRLRENEELQAHSNWNPHEHPEWLLLEIDNNLLIRPSQIDVARAIISPSSASNSVLQMNMGQGKTSCIIPMAVAMLADRKDLCRLVVPRALLLQTAQVVQSRIGGLLGRVVRHVPFSRRSPMGLESISLYQMIHKHIRDTGGVMICLPEHIMSFKLSGLQQLVDGELKRAKRMTDVQRWLEANSRDVLDESDFTLSTKTQLIYPSGLPMAVDGHPKRWLVIEGLLSLVEGHIPYLQSRYGDGIDIMRRHQGYPIMHILRPKVEDTLIFLLIEDVSRGRLPQLQFKNAADIKAQQHVRSVVMGMTDLSICQRAAEFLTDEVFGMQSLYLLKGLISEGLLLTCLKKRWNVQYGLHPQRAPIAVPFEAKDVPSLTAEYGHPDTTLILTCLAFYQTGLTQTQMVQCLDHIIRSDDPTMQYERLIHGCKLPARLECWNFLTLDDDAQMEDLWKHVRFDTNIINYFLNNFAFPAHAKQFGVKLQASGWDIPLLSNDKGPSTNLTTGFSGTNDNKRLLPQTIKQDDLPSLVQTNAEVLSYLLEERNQRCYQAIDMNGQHLTERGLLALLGREEIRILIDAGACILEMENKDLAAAWLEIFPDAQGAVYFGNDSRLMVHARFQKQPVPLLASPFADNLKDCVVYIDEAHTRGTDLKLPVDAKGAVTLGLGQTKDQTVQAAMRLRQLRSTQSVAFIAPPEVHRSILDLRLNVENKFAPVTSTDVIYWLLEQSCKANEKMMPLYIAQGFDFCQRTNALWKYRNFSQDPAKRYKLLSQIQQREDQTLEQLYGPRGIIPTTEVMENLDFGCLKGFTTRLCEEKLDQSGGYSSAFEELELEREVEFEFEQLRDKQKPVKYNADTFPGLDPAITHFVATGYLTGYGIFIPAFEFLGGTKIGRKFGLRGASSRLFVSQQFTRSIASKGHAVAVEVMRPVEWILWCSKTETAVIIIPEEAELLLTMLRDSPNISVSLLTYAAPVTRAMWRFNTLDYFTIPSRDTTPVFPPWLAIEIGVLAGRLYFDYSEYADLVSWLGISQDEMPRPIPKASQLETRRVTRGLFVDQTLKFLLEWLTYRRQTQDIMHTPMGFLCQGKKLEPGLSFFSFTTASQEEHETRRAIEGHVVAKLDEGVSDDDGDWDDGDELMIPEGEQMEGGLDTDM